MTSQPRIDLSAPWHHAESTIQREAPGQGRYRVRAQFISGQPPDYEYCTVNFWLPADTGHDRRVDFLACCEITNSRLLPSDFEGLELPTRSVR